MRAIAGGAMTMTSHRQLGTGPAAKTRIPSSWVSPNVPQVAKQGRRSRGNRFSQSSLWQGPVSIESTVTCGSSGTITRIALRAGQDDRVYLDNVPERRTFFGD